ncbi:hypothetical protein L3Y34_017782 [Caenorhabditis briggsae]|uniref:Transposase Tc5 C-terminal domain-containing protein n=1 Tax=Caenorhabditis briggsae TaxID=6238 RepID=A0AAE9ITQ9_CAEBR|nr:hypothetical protein L3Y34_017782 [Caenorhabditis briggsae]
MLFMDGTLGPKAFMVLSEPTGHFPPTRPIPNCPNLEVRAGKSHIMTKDMMCDWLKSCVFIPSVPKKLFMLIDSWPSFKDHQTIENCVPRGYDVTIRNIPPNTTGLIQPLDAHWNGPWKNFLKKFTAYALIFYPDYIIAQRNNEIWMISLVYHQFSAREFQPFLKYSWKKTGYSDFYSPFLTPSEYCFGKVDHEDCYSPNCPNLAFIKCSRCKEFICFEHFIIKDKHLCTSV